MTTHSNSSTSTAPDVNSGLATAEKHTPDVQPRRLDNGYSIDSNQQYRNNLMWQVGLLELTNALDFPANIWNEIPTPLFASVLMGIGGSIAVLWSIYPFWDMHKSLVNIRLLRAERQYLKRWQQEFGDNDSLETRCLVQAWLDVNVRELGWECIDRVMLDICAGISGVLVGIGAIMAIRGDIDAVYTVSNLLSGYIGNSFLAPFALLNSFWAVFMCIRADGERKVLNRGQVQIDQELQVKLLHHGRRHRTYAVVNGLTAVIGCIGSIISATLWYGYVIIAPCVFTSVYANLLWRHRMGYDRNMVRRKEDLRHMDLLQKLRHIQSAVDAASTGTIDQLPCFGSTENISTSIGHFLMEVGLYKEASYLLAEKTAMSEECLVDQAYVASLDYDVVVRVGVTSILSNRKLLAYQERFYVELYGRYCRSMEEQALPDKEEAKLG